MPDLTVFSEQQIIPTSTRSRHPSAGMTTARWGKTHVRFRYIPEVEFTVKPQRQSPLPKGLHGLFC
jgi:hypothetical protein